MTVYLAVWFIGVNELIWLFVHEGIVTFCLLFAALLAIVAGLCIQDVRREKRNTGHRKAGGLDSNQHRHIARYACVIAFRSQRLDRAAHCPACHQLRYRLSTGILSQRRLHEYHPQQKQ